MLTGQKHCSKAHNHAPCGVMKTVHGVLGIVMWCVGSAWSEGTNQMPFYLSHVS